VPIESLDQRGSNLLTCDESITLVRRRCAHHGRWGADNCGRRSFLESNISASATIVPLNNGGFTVGDYIEIDQEYMLSKSIAGNNLTVFRGQLGSTESTHNQYAVVFEYTLQLSGLHPNGECCLGRRHPAGDYIQVGSEDMSVTVVNCRN